MRSFYEKVCRMLRPLSPLGLIRETKLLRFDSEQIPPAFLLVSAAECHYLYEKRNRFWPALKEARSRLSRVPQSLPQEEILLWILDSNDNYYQGTYEVSSTLCKKAIERIEEMQGEIRRGKNHPKDRRNLDFLSICLALLYSNLATILNSGGRDFVCVEKAISDALDIRPDFWWLREKLAFLHAEGGNWEAAENAFQDASAYYQPPRMAAKRLESNLAYVRCSRAEKMIDAKQFKEAQAVLDRTIADLAASDQETDSVAPSTDPSRQKNDPSEGENEKHANSGVVAVADHPANTDVEEGARREEENRQQHRKNRYGWEGRAHFLLAEMFKKGALLPEAAAEYARCADCYECAEAFDAAAFASQRRGDELARLKRWDDAIDAYGGGRNLAGCIVDPAQKRYRVASLQAREGAGYLGVKQFNAASKNLDDSVQLLDGDYQALGVEVAPLFEGTDLNASYKLYIDGKLRSAADVRAARGLVFAMRDLHKGVSDGIAAECEPTESSPVNFVAPIVLEIDANVLKRSDETGRTFVEQGCSAIRDQIKRDYGVNVPPIRILENENLGPGQYILLINEVAREFSRISRDHWGWPDRPDKAQEQGAGATSPAPDANVSGRPLEEIFNPPLERLAALIVANLAELVGHQEVRNLLQGIGQYKQGQSEAIIESETWKHMDPLTHVIRVLLSERVPITNLAAIYDAFRRGWLAGRSILQLVEEIRSLPSVRPRLWGNDGNHTFVQLAGFVEEELRNKLVGPSGQVLAIEPERLTAILVSIRQTTSGTDKPVLLVRDPHLRSIVRRMVEEDDLPNLPVLSFREVLPEFWDRVMDADGMSIKQMELHRRIGATPSEVQHAQ